VKEVPREEQEEEEQSTPGTSTFVEDQDGHDEQCTTVPESEHAFCLCVCVHDVSADDDVRFIAYSRACTKSMHKHKPGHAHTHTHTQRIARHVTRHVAVVPTCFNSNKRYTC
jgi:hypothetical protein